MSILTTAQTAYDAGDYDRALQLLLPLSFHQVCQKIGDIVMLSGGQYFHNFSIDQFVATIFKRVLYKLIESQLGLGLN